MTFGLNLRGDLAKLDLREIETRIDRLIAEREAVSAATNNLGTIGNRWLYDRGLGLPFGRGLIRARLIYLITATFYGGSHKSGLGRLYMIDCELKDLLDECKRRVARDRGVEEKPK
jgi:hypothetical protein